MTSHFEYMKARIKTIRIISYSEPRPLKSEHDAERLQNGSILEEVRYLFFCAGLVILDLDICDNVMGKYTSLNEQSQPHHGSACGERLKTDTQHW